MIWLSLMCMGIFVYFFPSKRSLRIKQEDNDNCNYSTEAMCSEPRHMQQRCFHEALAKKVNPRSAFSKRCNNDAGESQKRDGGGYP